MSNAPQNKNHQSLYTTRTNKISSTLSVMDPLKLQQQQQQSESILTNRQSHRKYKLSHSQITKIDKMSRQGLLRWKQSRQSQDEGNGNNFNNNSKGDRSNNTKSKTSFTIATTNNNTRNSDKQQQKINRKSFAFNEGNNNKNNNNSKQKRQHLQQQQDNIITTSDNETTNGIQKKDDSKHIRRSISSRNSNSNNGDNNIHSNIHSNSKSKSKMDKSLQQRQHNKQLRKITQNTTSMHSIINYKLKKDKLIELLQDQSMTLHVQVIEFDLGKRERERRGYFGDNQDDENQNDNQNDEKIKFKNFQQHELYQSRKLQKSQQQKQQKSQKLQNKKNNIIQVICFQIHNKQTNMHYRSQFTYKTLGKDVKFVFEDIQQLFQYVTTTSIGQSQQQNSMIVFNQQTMQLQVRIQFMRTGQQQQKQKQQQQQSMKPIKKSKKIIKLPLLPFAMIEIIQHHPNQLQQQKQKKQFLLEIKQLKRDLELSRNLVHALRDQNDKLKLKLNKEKIEAQKEKAHKEMIIESYQKLSRVSQKPNKEYYFQFVPDMKAKNFNNFTFKNNILKKVKNDLKWDQVSSEAPLPKAGRHYFSFLIKDFMPDFMFGIVTMKGKDTSNAFLGLETICLYASKNNCYIYQRGKHYKISVNVKRNDVVFVIIDRQKNVIEWVKKKGSFGNSKQGSPKAKDYQQKFLIQPHMDHKTSLASITPVQQHLPSRHTQDDMPIQNQHYLHNNEYRHRKTSQTISSTQFPINQLSAISILPLTTAVEYYQTQQIDYIHSTILPQQMVQKQLYGYLEVYNVNQPLKMNERK